MADEIAQVVDMEYKGVYYLFKGTKAMIAMMARFVKALHNWENENYLKRQGNCSWEKMQKISNGTPPIIEFPKEMFKKKEVEDGYGNKIMKSDFELYCEKYKLRYCMLPDLNPNDDYIPVAVPAQDMGIHQEQIKAVMGRRIKTEEAKNDEYDIKIKEAKEKIETASTPEEKEAAEKELTMLLEAKEQNENLLSESKDKFEKDNILDFAEYLQQGEGSLAEFDPALALTQQNKCGIVREYTPYDCMWPVRDENLVPESREIYYSQRTSDDKIHVIRREFLSDEQGHIYSQYYVKRPGSNTEKMFSDYGLSKEGWQEQIPNMLKEAGLVNEEMTAVVQSKERFLKYQEFVEENFKDAQAANTKKEKTEEYSSDEAKRFVKEHNEQTIQRQSYEDSLYTTVTVPVTKLMQDGEEVMCLELSQGLLKGVMVDSMDEKNAKIFIKGDHKYSVEKPDGKTMEMSGKDIIANTLGDAKEVASRAISRKGR
ncbi:MAG: hypothetical protein PHX08_10715 [Lachnospiraceae bacterium]|nr:hypothetical protein [Lachnospiraceae bacterium]